MTIETTTNTINHNPDGVTTSFGYNFRVDSPAHMAVYADGVDYSASKSITGIGNPLGGNVIFDVAPAASIEKLTLLREVPYTQEVSYPVVGLFPSSSHEMALDKLVMLTQQLKERIGRTLVASPGDSNSYILPAYEAGKFWRWNPLSQAIEVVDITGQPVTPVGNAIGDLLAWQNISGSPGIYGGLTQAKIAALANGTANQENLIINGSFEDWTNTASFAAGWSGSGGTAAREASISIHENYSQKLTSSGAQCYAMQTTLAGIRGIWYWRGRTVSFSCLVYCGTANIARIGISDGVGVSYSSYHTGNNTWQLLTVTHTMSGSASALRPYLYVDAAGYAFFDAAMLVDGPMPASFQQKNMEDGVWYDYSGISTINGWASFTEKTIAIKRMGNNLLVWVSLVGTSNSTVTNFTLPLNSLNQGSNVYGHLRAEDNSSWLTQGPFMQLSGNANTVVAYPIAGAPPWTASGVKAIQGTLIVPLPQ